METSIVGNRFYPTGEELINHYLKNKIIGKTWLVDDVINEINICSYEPLSLPREFFSPCALSKLKSKDLVWYFFSPKVYASAKKKTMKRTTRFGYWKVTGRDQKIREKRRNGVEVGIKKTLVYHQGRVSSGVCTPWVMHEYHITCLPLHQRNYVICKIIYKGEAEDIPSGSNSSEPSHSLVIDSTPAIAISTPPEVEQAGGESFSVNDFTLLMNEQEDPKTFLSNNNNNSNAQLQTPYLTEDDDEFLGGLMHVNRREVDYLFSDQELCRVHIETVQHRMQRR